MIGSQMYPIRGETKQLFVDDYVVQEVDNLARKLHQPQKFAGNAVIRPEHRWENRAIQIRQAPVWVPDEAVYKMVYHATAESLDPEATLTMTGSAPSEGFECCAVSQDGANWEKPFLGLCDYPGILWNGKPVGGQNNILGPSGGRRWVAPVYDASDPDPGRRYKGLGWQSGSTGWKPVVSADCLHWRFLDVPPILSSDTAKLTYDEEKGRFVLTVKHGGPYGRSVYLTTSEDFENWTEQELIFHADQIDQENGCERLSKFFEDPAYKRPAINRPEEWRTDVYHMGVFPYEGLYLGTPTLFHSSGKHPPLYENTDGRNTVELVSSRDLRHWDRVGGRAPFLELSPVGDGGAYDTGQIGPANRPIIRGNEIWFYYYGYRHRSQSPVDITSRRHLDAAAICMARLRLDGFVSFKGGVEWGSVLTKPLVVQDKELHINVDSWRGQVRAEIWDLSEGGPIPGFTREESIPAVTDSTDKTLRWVDKRGMGELLGKTVRIRFHVLQAQLYAFWFASKRQCNS